MIKVLPFEYKTADLHLLCFCIAGHCFCPGNLQYKKKRQRNKLNHRTAGSKCLYFDGYLKFE